MAERKRTPKGKRKQPARRKRTVATRKTLWDRIQALRRPRADFRPDSEGTALLKLLHLTQHQRDIYLRWGLYIAVCLLALIIQDVIMSRIHILGATTDLPVCAIMMIAVIEGSEVGSVFALLASIFYHFSGSAPGAYCVGFITVLSLLAGLFRQMFWHRSAGSIVLCTGIAVTAYEVALYAAGLFLGLTRWDRLGYFLMTSILCVLVLIPLYKLIHRIGLIGGNTWKE